VKKILIGILASCLVIGLSIQAMADVKDVQEKAGDAKVVLYAITEEPAEEGDTLRFGGFVELNFTQKMRGRVEFVNFEEKDKMAPIASLLYGFYPGKNFSPHLGVGVRLGHEKPKYLQIAMGFVYKPWKLFGEAKFVMEETSEMVDIEESKLFLCVGRKI